jgi:hypothetical protein
MCPGNLASRYKKGCNEVRLQAPGLGPFHFFFYFSNFGDIHGIPGQGSLFEKLLQRLGLEAHASALNPVAVLITKALC